MKRICAVFLALLLLCGCSPALPETLPTQPSDPAQPPVGTPGTVTERNDYSGQGDAAAAVARAGEAVLTNGELNVWYWSEIADCRQRPDREQPDYTLPLQTQACPVDAGVNSWQQYFLQRALNRWHSVQVLAAASRERGLPLEAAYSPDLQLHRENLQDVPSTAVLYGYHRAYRPNSMHQAFLDSLPDRVEALAKTAGCTDGETFCRTQFGAGKKELLDAARALNLGYMYYTDLGYAMEKKEEQIPDRVDIRLILLTGEHRETQARMLLDSWDKPSEAAFGELAFRHSQDPGSACTGGAYRMLEKGQLPEALDSWCFDPQRRSGDYTQIATEQETYILYFSGGGRERILPQLHVILEENAFPMTVDYGAIALAQGGGAASLEALLYPDVAHQRFPEIPLYLQQDYGDTLYGDYSLASNGCGITCYAMMASYLLDEIITPAQLCARFGSYSYLTGTDAMLYVRESPGLGFYFRECTYRPGEAKKLLAQGYPMVSLQAPGYWTTTGHYILLEKLNGDDTVQVRDPNLEAYGKIPGHKQDRHSWQSILEAGCGFWIFEKKVTAIPACTRCGDPEALEIQVCRGYLCPGCRWALARRELYWATAEGA